MTQNIGIGAAVTVMMILAIIMIKLSAGPAAVCPVPLVGGWLALTSAATASWERRQQLAMVI